MGDQNVNCKPAKGHARLTDPKHVFKHNAQNCHHLVCNSHIFSCFVTPSNYTSIPFFSSELDKNQLSVLSDSIPYRISNISTTNYDFSM